MPFPIGGPLEPSLCSNGFRDIQRRMYECNTMVDLTLIRPLNKGQGHSFLVPVDSSHTNSYRLSTVTFALGRTV